MGRAKSVNLPTRMRKRVRLSPTHSNHESGDKELKFLEKAEDDRISKLPDDVLVSILSLLSITDAARTSVLSHRWEKLWTFYTGSLKFDFNERLEGVVLWRPERSKYISQVNQVMASLVGSTLDDFTLRVDAEDLSTSQLDRWVEFAMGKTVQRLELSTPTLIRVLGKFVPYAFPLDCYARIKQPCGLYRISALTSLSLSFINLPGGFLECFLSSCPLLERLCLVRLQNVLNLKVAGADLKLKYLEISYCSFLEYVEIAAPNLLSLNYWGLEIKLHIENAPQLIAVSIGGDVITFMSSLSSYVSQLETLQLHFRLAFDFEMNQKFTQSLQPTRIKHLTLSVSISDSIDSLLGWTSLIEACPFMQKFTLELYCDGKVDDDERGTLQKVTVTCPHKFLKVVEFVGFIGCEIDIELAMYFIANASALEKVIIDRRSRAWRSVGKKEAKKRALQLKKYLPPGVDFVLI